MKNFIENFMQPEIRNKLRAARAIPEVLPLPRCTAEPVVPDYGNCDCESVGDHAPITLLRVLLAIARLRSGEQITPCLNRSWQDCITVEMGNPWLWFNDHNGSTRIAHIDFNGRFAA